jgi:hypothetical protein
LLKTKVIECYTSQGYEVIYQPHIQQLPFDLNGYSPDLIVKISEAKGCIGAIRDTALNIVISPKTLRGIVAGDFC